ncbi:glycosyl hydrolase family 92-domain-containing protein [Paraphoma chrysanthemicola]|uniref:Glycosyl hydrolase family 92-domain-containing protein n=1 Tax=Paraphoma chrysanthemicola TaxID=798071 RepID=A0A8K0QZ97_9PLEO|nr:glycosyl hydrolase family 92-domain-containing protein [Paraphoma chrysanthemicola]
MNLLIRKIAPAVVWGILVKHAVAQNGTGRSGYDYVDPLIGTTNGGHVFPGATLPFGMAKAGPDIYGENQGGFASDGSPIYGFSHMHDSGTGGSPSLGNFPIFAQSGCPNGDINACKYVLWERMTDRINGTIHARPGYFDITLASNIRTEMTVTNHTALYRFTFPATPITPNTTSNPHILVELTDLPQTRSEGNITVYPSNGRITGSGRFSPSFGIGTYQSYFCLDFNGATVKDAGVWSNSRAARATSFKIVPGDVRQTPSDRPAGGWVQFEQPKENNQILARVGMSFISEAQACANAEREIPRNNFDAIVAAAESAWRAKLDVITIDGGSVSDSFLTTFWSGVYRSMISPQDYTGENPNWNSGEPYYDSFYCIWDSFRSIHPLLTLLDPQSQTLMIRSLLDIYRHEGWLPDCRMSHCKGFTQGGSNADIVITDAYLKNISEGIDWNLAYEAVVKDAEEEPPNWDVEGRGGLESWKTLGYIPTENIDVLGVGTETRSISRTVEYAYNDFTIALLARALGHTSDYNKYLARSGNWLNMFKPDQRSDINGTDTGFQGFLQPRYTNGTWGYQDPIFCSPLLDFTGCYLNPSGRETYEGPVWLYTFFAPGDMATLIRTLGGRETFVQRLNWLHESGILYVGDEQAFLKLFLYHYAGRPALSAQRAHQYIPSLFNDTVSGIPGNDDSGAMGSFVAFVMMGFFPNAGQDVYFIIPPFFESVSIKNGQTGKTATIRNVNFDAGYKNIYIQSAKMNGVSYTRNWLQHGFFLEGGVLELVLGDSESAWGTRVEDGPPSLGPYSNGTAARRRWDMGSVDLGFGAGGL